MWLFLRFFGCNGFGTTSRENIGFWKRTRPEQTEENNLENQITETMKKWAQKQKKLGKLHVCVGLFLVAFILVILHVGWFFGEFAFWLCFYSICFFQCVAETNFLCWSWCRNTKANESHWISCVSNHISSYFTPKCIQRRGEPVPPFIHTFLNFYFSWSKTYCKVFLFWFKKDLHKDLIGFCVYPTTSNHV